MDTIPFHFVMFALDIVLVLGLIVWPFKKTIGGTLGGVVLFSMVGLFGIIFFAVVFRSNIGQCVAEGLTYHGSVFLLFVGVLFVFRRHFVLAGLSVLLGLFLFGIGFDMLVLEPYSLVVEHYTIETTKLKKPLKVVFLADIQTDRIGEHERRTLRLVQEQKPDLIILGGDYLQYYEGTPGVDGLPERFRRLFEDAKLTAPLGVYAISGNVDPSSAEAFSELFEGTGIEAVYMSEIIENVGVDKDLGPIDLTLLHYFDAIDGVGDRGLTETGNFQIMAGHYPNYAIKDFMHAKRAPDLMLAGHTHGGQIYVPGFGPLRIKYHGRDAITRASMYRGMFTFENGSHLLVSRGSGMERGWAPRVRFLCKPEISVIEIVPKPSIP